MSIMKRILAFRYAGKNLGMSDSINKELDAYQSILENLGFAVTRSEHLFNYDPSQRLTAEKGTIVLRVIRSLQGGGDMSIIIKRGDQEKIIPLFPYKLGEAITVANAAQYLVR